MSTPAPHRILIVDDEPDVHSITKLTLRGLTYKGRGIELATAISGKEAVAVAARDFHSSAISRPVGGKREEHRSGGRQRGEPYHNDDGQRFHS